MARIRGPLPFDQFSQRVRRHRPTEVLAAVARYSAALEADGFWFGEWPGQPVQVQYFALAGAARAALLYGNEFRDSGVSDGDVIEMCIYFGEVDDPATKQEPGLDRMRGMLLRYLYDQAPYQYSPMENIARSVALFLEHADDCDGALTENEWRGLLGVSLEEFMRIGFVLHTAAIRNGGQVARDTLRAPHVAPIFTPLATDEAIARARAPRLRLARGRPARRRRPLCRRPRLRPTRTARGPAAATHAAPRCRAVGRHASHPRRTLRRRCRAHRTSSRSRPSRR